MLMRFDPFREFDRLAGEAGGTRRTSLPMDATRDGDVVTIAFDLPGVDRASIDITVEKNEVAIEAERRWMPADDVQVLASERPHGTFRRTLLLGDNLDPDALEADYRDGVLTLQVPVAEAAKPRKVSVGEDHHALSS